MPFFEDLIVALILIVPGFISINLSLYLFGTSRDLSEFEKGSWSLFLSFIVDALFFWHHDLEMINLQETEAFAIWLLNWEYIIELFSISIFIGFLCALFLRSGILDIFHNSVWFFSERKNYIQSPWEISLKKADWIIVTSDETEYYGLLLAYSTHEQKKEIVLGYPEIIVRDDEGGVLEEISCGERLIIPEGKIDNVIVVSTKQSQTIIEKLKARVSRKK